MSTAAAPPVVLMAASQESPQIGVLHGIAHEVYHVRSGALAIDCAGSLRPDVILISLDLLDMTGIAACRALRAHPRVGRNIPILLLASEPPTPEQRVAGFDAGAWDFVRYPDEPEQFSLRVQAYVQAKRNIDVVLAETAAVPEAFVHTRSGLARRARELGALMARMRGALACVVFVVDDDKESTAGALVARAARVSDIVGTLRPSEFAVIAPATDENGAVLLARRVLAMMQRGNGGEHAAPTLNVGYDVVANVTYRPIDPVALLARASAAVRIGKPLPGSPWLRRFDESVSWTPPATEPADDVTAPAGRVSRP